MIISDKNKYIFIRTQKVGGTSITRALPKPNRGFMKSDRTWIEGQTGRRMDPNHIPAKYIKQLIDPCKVDEYFKFSIARNPYDRAVSLYHYLTRMGKHKYINFECFIRNIHKIEGYGVQMSQSEFIGEVDYVIKFENLQTDFNTVCKKIGVPHKQLQHYKKTDNRRHYRDYYDDETKQIIVNKFQDDIDRFGYTF